MRIALAAIFLTCAPAYANSLGSETMFAKNILTQTLAYDGHQNLMTHSFKDGIWTWNFAGSLAKTKGGGTESSTIGLGAGVGWRNMTWDISGGLAYSDNSTTKTTTIGPSLTVGYRYEFRNRKRRPKPKPQPQGKAKEQMSTAELDALIDDGSMSEEMSFKPSITTRGGIRYQKLKQVQSSATSTPDPITGALLESSQTLNQLSLSATMLFNPRPWVAIGGGYTHFSYSEESTSSALGGALSDYFNNLSPEEQQYLASTGALSSFGSLAELSQLSGLGSIGAGDLAKYGVSPDAPVFGSAFTFGGLPKDSLDAILMFFPATWLDVETRFTITTLNGTSEVAKDLRAALYFHLSQAWTLGAGLEHAYDSASTQDFFSTTLSYAFY